MKLTLLGVSHHRNGIHGAGFDSVIFKDKDYPDLTFHASVFEEKGYCAVHSIEKLSVLNIKFGNNSWRGDEYERCLRPLIVKYYQELDEENENG